MAVPSSNSGCPDDLKTLLYFQHHFGLQVDATTGTVIDDPYLRFLFTVVYKLFQKELTIDDILTTLNASNRINPKKDKIRDGLAKMGMSVDQNCDEDSTIEEVKVEPTFEEMLPDILIKIKEQVAEKNGQHVLNLLDHLAVLANQPIDLKFCFRLYFPQTADDDTKNEGLAGQKKKGVKEICGGDLNGKIRKNMTKMKMMLKILEDHSLIRKQEVSIMDHDDVEEEEGHHDPVDGADDLFAIVVDPVVHKYLREKGPKQDEGQGVWSSCVLRIAKFLAHPGQIRRPKLAPHFTSLHDALKELSWPNQSYDHSLQFGTTMAANYGNSLSNGGGEDARKILTDLYALFRQIHAPNPVDENDEEDWIKNEESFTLCKLALIHLQNLKMAEEGADIGAWKCPEKSLMDNTGIFNEKDVLVKIDRLKLFDWVLAHALEYPHSELMQFFAAQILMGPLVVHEFPLDHVRHAQMISWIRQYCRHKANENGADGQQPLFNLDETPINVIKITMQLLPSVKVIQMAAYMSRASSVYESKGADKRSWFLQETLYMTKPSPICVWEQQEELSEAKLFEMGEICLVYVEQGETCFIAMLTELEQTFNRDYSLDLHFLDFLETMKAAAYFDKCVEILLESTELLSSLRKTFNKIVHSIEAIEEGHGGGDDCGGHGGNIKAVCHILIFWYALMTNSKRIHRANKAIAVMVKDMEKFHHQLTQEDSPVCQAFNEEKHWHSYFREQGETCERILEKFLAMPRDYESLMKLSKVYQLAEKLKTTTKKDWWSSSFNFISTATRAFGGSGGGGAHGGGDNEGEYKRRLKHQDSDIFNDISVPVRFQRAESEEWNSDE